ncbi:MAG: deoxyribose-phosphate aldolase [Deltaproteobacteria bacterium]|nr:deoxyribose-phosphate aldolase [Deltaproteobacteria bacterium]
MEQRDIDRIVEAVAQRIRERVGAAAPAPHVCSASAETCAACGDCASRRPEDVGRIVQLGAARVASAPNVTGVRTDLARFIDHTLLAPDATQEQLRKLCEEAKRFGFYSVCVNSANVAFCRSLLAGTPVKVVAVVGFPLGAMSPGAKAFETREALQAGAEEVDMVLNIGELKSRQYARVLEDIRKVVDAARPRAVKVILETSKLTATEKIIACALSKAAGARFVKTSTGFGGGGATAEDVALMKEVVGPDMEVKASGGVRTIADAQAMIAAGATRIGASASVEIVQGKTAKTAY